MTKFTKIFAMFILAAFVFTTTGFVAEAKTTKKTDKKECSSMKDCKKECMDKASKDCKKECKDAKGCKAECKDTKMSKASNKECCKDGKECKATKASKTTKTKTTDAEPVKTVK